MNRTHQAIADAITTTYTPSTNGAIASKTIAGGIVSQLGYKPSTRLVTAVIEKMTPVPFQKAVNGAGNPHAEIRWRVKHVNHAGPPQVSWPELEDWIRANLVPSDTDSIKSSEILERAGLKGDTRHAGKVLAKLGFEQSVKLGEKNKGYWMATDASAQASAVRPVIPTGVDVSRLSTRGINYVAAKIEAANERSDAVIRFRRAKQKFEANKAAIADLEG